MIHIHEYDEDENIPIFYREQLVKLFHKFDLDNLHHLKRSSDAGIDEVVEDENICDPQDTVVFVTRGTLVLSAMIVYSYELEDVGQKIYHISKAYTRKDHRRKGYAKFIVDYIRRVIVDDGCDLEAYWHRNKDDACSFWNKMGVSEFKPET